MPPGTPPLQFNHQPGQQIPTKDKEAIRQLYGFAKIPIEGLMAQYKLGRSTITKILEYKAPECSRNSRTGRPSLLTDKQVDEIIEYAAEFWEHRVLDP
jgi:transposase